MLAMPPSNALESPCLPSGCISFCHREVVSTRRWKSRIPDLSPQKGRTTRRRRRGRRKTASCTRWRSVANVGRSTICVLLRRERMAPNSCHARHCCMSLTRTCLATLASSLLRMAASGARTRTCPTTLSRCEEAVRASRRIIKPTFLGAFG